MRMTEPQCQREDAAWSVLTADAAFEAALRATFGASEQIELRVVSGTIAGQSTKLDTEGATVVVIDLDAGQRRGDAGAGTR